MSDDIGCAGASERWNAGSTRSASGCRAARGATTDIDAMTIPLVMHVTLGDIESASEVDKDRLMVMQLPDMQRSRFYLDPAMCVVLNLS